MKKKNGLYIITLSLILLFGYTSTTKIVDYEAFKEEMNSAGINNAHAATLIWIIPVYELIIVFLLMIKKTRLAGLYGSLFFLLPATAYIIILSANEPILKCACGGFLEQMPSVTHIFFNLLFILISIAGIWIIKPPVKLIHSV